MEARLPREPQLIIFYSGSVVVFDNVPADRAEAILQVLSEDNSSRDRGTLDCEGENPLMPTQQPVIDDAKSSYSLPTQGPEIEGTQTQTMMQVVNNTQITQLDQKPTPAFIKKSQAELPFPRKAFHARVLDKRKDRLAEALKRNEDANACSDNDDMQVLGSICSKRKRVDKFL